MVELKGIEWYLFDQENICWLYADFMLIFYADLPESKQRKRIVFHQETWSLNGDKTARNGGA